MIGTFSFSASVERYIDGTAKNATIYGKMSQRFEKNFPFCQEGEIVLFMKMSITQIIMMDDDGDVQDILQKPFMPNFKKVYFVARYPSIKDFKHLQISGEKENQRNRVFFERFQKEFEKEINEIFK